MARDNLPSPDLAELLVVVPERPEKIAPKDRRWGSVQVDASRILPEIGIGVAIGVLAAELYAKRKRRDTPGVTALNYSDARDLQNKGLLTFPNGGPKIKQLYARHPLRQSHYLPYADFHREIVQERAIEMARYLLSLGATEVRIGWQQQGSQTIKGRAALENPTPADVAAGLGMAREHDGELAISYSGSGKSRPDATDLIWPAADPVFRLVRAAAEGSTFHFGMKGHHSSTVSLEAGAKLQKQLGFSLGGKYKRWEDLTFVVDASFRGDS